MRTTQSGYRGRLLKAVVAITVFAAVMPLSSPADAMDTEPDLIYVTTTGGNQGDVGYSVAVDAAGNTYITGSFSGTGDFDGNPATVADQHTSNGAADAFVASYDPAGALRWVTPFGGSQFDLGNSVVVDAAGNTYVTGRFSDTGDFDGNPSTTADQRVSNGSADIFVASYDPTGAYRWVNTAGGSGLDTGYSVAVDAAGNTYTTGNFTGTADFDGNPSTTADQRVSNGSADIFVASYDPTGAYRWVNTAGGTSSDTGLSVAVDATGNTYITGGWQGTVDFDGDPATSGDQRVSNGSSDIFVASYDPTGAYRWVTAAGGTNADAGLSVAVDAVGNTYITGYFLFTGDFDGDVATTADERVSNGFFDIFIASYDPNGIYRWVTATGGTGGDIGHSVAVDAAGNTHITGSFDGTGDFDGNPATVADKRTSIGLEDIFVASYGPDGTYRWVTAAASTNADIGRSVAVDASGIHVTGYFSGTADFDGDPATTADERASNGGTDIFVMRLAVVDMDGDGFQGANGDGTDCDDTDPAINPDAVEIAGDGIDQDCDGFDATAQLCRGLAVTIDMNLGGTGFGTAGDDVIFGTPGPDVIDGMDGDDTICGNGGDDNISGSGGLDFILGGDGNDIMTGGDGNDRIRGQQGVDSINGGPGNDFLYGGIEGDTIIGGDGNDVIGGFGGADIIDSGPGNDTIFGGFGADIINAGPGNDTVAGLIGNDTINGDAGDDLLNGDNGQDIINGGPGNDTINGGNSLDTLNGNDGDDNINGGKADDTLSGGPGTDVCTGNKHTIGDTADATCETTFGIP